MESLFEKSSINTDFAATSKVVYGFPKSGKTTFAAYAKTKDGREPLFIPTERGHGAIEVTQTPLVTRWEDFQSVFTDKIYPNRNQIQETYSGFVLDHATDLDAMVAEYTAKQHSVNHVSEVGGFGKGYQEATKEFKKWIDMLFAILPVTFIAHSKEKEMIWNGEKSKMQAPDLSTGLLKYINGRVDLICWIKPGTPGKDETVISIENTTTSIGGCRYPQMVRSFPFHFKDVNQTYQEMQQTFEGGQL